MKNKKLSKASMMGFEVLEFLKDNGEYYSFNELHKDFNRGRQKVGYSYLNKTVRRLSSQGLVDRESQNLGYLCQINETGLAYLDDVSRGIREVDGICRTHNLVFSVEILSRTHKSFPGFRIAKAKMKNWKYPILSLRFDKIIFIQVKNNTLEIRFSNIYGMTAKAIIYDALETVIEIISNLEQEDSTLRFGAPKKVAVVTQQHHAINHAKFSEFLETFYICWKDDLIHVDKSKNYPELEFVHKRDADTHFDNFIEFARAVATDQFPWRELSEMVKNERKGGGGNE